MTLDAFGHSHPGRRRIDNEDSYLCLRPVRGEDAFLLAVADGMGGHAGGSTASDIAIAGLRRSIEGHLGSPDRRDPPWRVLEASFEEVNRAIWDTALSREELRGMGTTLVAALVEGERATIGSIGDSRCYHLHDGVLRQVTEDHSWAAEQLKLGALSSEEISASPLRSSITRVLGFDESIEPDFFQVSLAVGDALILCTDGTHGLLPDSEIERTTIASEDAENLCRRLIEQSNDAGGTDNATVVAAFVAPAEGGPPASATQPIPTVAGDRTGSG